MLLGGICGSGGQIYECINYSDNLSINRPANHGDLGGIAGSGTIIDGCINYGNISSKGYYIGGIARSATTISNCVNYGNILNGTQKGGICVSASIIEGCSNNGDISGIGGGISYSTNGRITACYNSGKASCGVTGSIGSAILVACYNVGQTSYGICGESSSPSYIINNCIALKDSYSLSIYGSCDSGNIFDGGDFSEDELKSATNTLNATIQSWNSNNPDKATKYRFENQNEGFPKIVSN